MNTSKILPAIFIFAASGMNAFAQTDTSASKTVKQQMIEVTIPVSNRVFSTASQESITADNWQQLKTDALSLVASGEWLLVFPAYRNQPVWQQSAGDFIAAAREVAKAGETKNLENVTAASDRLFESCQGCHTHYLKNSASKPH
jgi:hypothetical protein